MEVFEAILARRSIRRFKKDPVPDELVARVMEAARLAPSGSNRQPWTTSSVARVTKPMPRPMTRKTKKQVVMDVSL